MSDEEFQSLALRVLTGEASLEEKAALQSVLAQDPARQAELDDLGETLKIAQVAGPMVSAMGAGDVELPRHRMGELRSAVRAHFKSRSAATASESQNVGWLEKFGLRFICGAGFAAACVVLVLVAMPGPSEIEVGLYAEPVMRSGSNAPVVQSTSTVHVNQFENDKTFEQWLASPFGKNEKARVWLDEEHDLIHARFRPTLFCPSRELTRPLPDAVPARRAAIQAVIGEIQKN